MSVRWGHVGCTLAGGRYRLVAPAGSGGTAVVWRAVDTVLGREVAVKVLHSPALGDGDAARGLRAEAQAIAQLKHRHITAIYDFGEEQAADGAIHQFVVMEFAVGRTVKDLLDTGQALDWRAATAIAAQVASALACAHGHGIVHRDISCTNVLLTDDGVKVLDFGMAVWHGRPESHDGEQVVGTPAYIAPERLRERHAPVTPAADVYALGLLWYQMMVAAMPWQARTATGLLQAHLVYAPAPLPAIESLPERLRELCMACLAKNPEDRPGSSELAAELARYAGETAAQPAATVTESLPIRSGRRNTAALAATAVLAAVAGHFWFAPPKPTGSAPAETLPTAVITPTSAPATTAADMAPATGPQNAAAVKSVPSTGQAIRVGGGTILVACTGERAAVVEVGVAPGYHIKDLKAGPAEEVRIVLKSSTGESEIKVTCDRGVATPVVKDNLKPPPPTRG